MTETDEAGPRRLDVITAEDSAACGFTFREGKKYTVPAGIDPADYGLPAGDRR